MKIKMKMTVQGAFHNIEGGVKVGDVVDIDDAEAERYIDLGYAEAVKPGGKLSEEHAVAALSTEERAVLTTDIIGAASDKPVRQTKPKSEPKPEPEVVAEPEPEPEKPKPVAPKPAAPKRGPGRPRKA